MFWRDRYVYTAFARDVVRGVDREWVRDLYNFAVRPDLAFFFKLPLETAIQRMVRGRPGFTFYEAGMDLGFSRDPLESFYSFQSRILEEYDLLVDEFGLVKVHGEKSIEQQQRQVRLLVRKALEAKGMEPTKKRGKGIQ